MSDLTTAACTDIATGLATLYTSLTSRIGIGDSGAAFVPAQTVLQGVNTAYKTATVSQAANRLTFDCTFLTSEGNGFTIREVCVDRDSGTRMLVRNVPTVSIPAKTSAEEWTFTIHVDFTAG